MLFHLRAAAVLNPVGSADFNRMTANLYTSGAYLDQNKTWHAEDSEWKAVHVIRLLQANEIHPSSVCEVGCGAGGILQAMESRMPDCTFTGYDISPQAIALCQTKESARLHFIQADLAKTPVQPYDVIMAMDVMEHVEDYLGFLRMLKTRARYKAFHIPLDLTVLGVVTRLPERVRISAGHLHYFSRSLALAALEESGYRVLDSFYTAGGLDLPAKTLRARIARLPRRLAYAMSPDLAARYLGGFSLMVLAE